MITQNEIQEEQLRLILNNHSEMLECAKRCVIQLTEALAELHEAFRIDQERVQRILIAQQGEIETLHKLIKILSEEKRDVLRMN